MCISRVGKVLAAKGGKAQVQFFDGRTSEGVDLSVAPASVGAYIEVFGNVALSTLSPSEVRKRRAVWNEIRKAAARERTETVQAV
jgi:hydrogenase maturation factor